MSCHVDELGPIHDAPPWFPEDSPGCRLTADSRAELAEMCRNVGLPPPAVGEDYQLLTPKKRFIALRYGAVDHGTIDLFGFEDAVLAEA